MWCIRVLIGIGSYGYAPKICLSRGKRHVSDKLVQNVTPRLGAPFYQTRRKTSPFRAEI